MSGTASASMKGKTKGSLDEILTDRAKVAFDKWMERGSSSRKSSPSSES